MGRNRPDARRCVPAPRGTQVRTEPESGRSPTFSPSSVPQTLVLPFLGSFSCSSPLWPLLSNTSQIPRLRLLEWKGARRLGEPLQCQPQHPFLRSTNSSTFRPVSSQYSQPSPQSLALFFLYPKQIHRADRLGQETFNWGSGGSAVPQQTHHAALCTVGIGPPLGYC